MRLRQQVRRDGSTDDPDVDGVNPPAGTLPETDRDVVNPAQGAVPPQGAPLVDTQEPDDEHDHDVDFVEGAAPQASDSTQTGQDEQPSLSASGQLHVTDVDVGEAAFQARTSADPVVGLYGSLVIDALGAWTYTLDNDSADGVQGFKSGRYANGYVGYSNGRRYDTRHQHHSSRYE